MSESTSDQDETPSAVVTQMWATFEARDWDGAAALLAADVLATWPASHERYDGRDAVIAVNRDFPGDWHAVVEEIIAAGDRVVARVTVTLDGAAETCIGFYGVARGEITTIDEWWVTEYPAPESRQGATVG